MLIKIVFLLFLFNQLFAQPILIKLTKRTVLDDKEVHITTFYNTPKEKLKLPEINNLHPKFFDIFYSWDVDDDEKISVMLIEQKDKELLYIDRNNDEDLTNDGSPFFFPKSKNEFIFDIIGKKDKQQITKILLKRKILFQDAKKQRTFDDFFFDSFGNLKNKIVFMYSMQNPDFKGKPGSFYFDDRICLSRGNIKIGKEIYAIGIFDYNNNGLFNDISNEHGDVLIIDLDRDGKLTYSNSNEVFTLDEIFRIQGQSYKVSKVDPYGKFVEITKTSEKPTFRFLKMMEERISKSSNFQRYKIDSSFWNYDFYDINNKRVDLSKLKNRYLLLNFWGEWCKPCLDEIPELIAIKKQYGNKLKILSFIKTNNIIKAKQIINDKKITWTQIKLKQKIEKQFNINGYPTNILISPSGEVVLNRNQINRYTIYKFLN